MRIVISIALAAALASCGGDKSDKQDKQDKQDKPDHPSDPKDQSFAEAMQLACNAPDAIRDGKPGDRIVMGMKLIAPTIYNKEARDLFKSFADQGVDKVQSLKAAVEKAHLSQCTLLELFRQLPAGRAMIDAYLARIGYAGSRAPTVETLQAIHEAHALAIPFENLDILLGRGVSLELPRLAAKLVDARRGGYCFEHNSLLAAALGELGFAVEILGARVRMGPPRPNLPPRTHCLLRVTIDGAPWLVDVGFGGDGLIHPLPWREDDELVTPSGRYRLAREGADTVLHASHFGAEPLALYLIRADDPLLPIDLEMASWYTSTHPSSPFTQRPIVQKIEPDRRLRLVAGELSIRHADGTVEKRAVADDELLAVLRADFGLDFAPGTRFSAAGASG